jgi:hypothetical protein
MVFALAAKSSVFAGRLARVQVSMRIAISIVIRNVLKQQESFLAWSNVIGVRN